jgi:type IV secretory pathway TrbD component
MRVRILSGLGVAALLGLGVWLWGRHGLAIWVDAAIAFCT